MNTAHRIEIKANNKQRTYFARAAGIARFSYNWALAEWKKEYEAGGKPTEAALRRKLNGIKQTEFPWMLEVTKNAPQEAIRQLGGAFKRFFKGESKYPKPRKKGIDDRFSLSNDQFDVRANKIRIPYLGWVSLKESFRYKGKICGATISRDADRWFVSISIDATAVYDRKKEEWKPFPQRRESQAAIGVDLGISSFATLSTGEEVKGPKPYKKLLSRLKKLQKNLSRKQKGSKNRGKAKMKLAKLHRQIRNIRSDAVHKLTHRLVQENSIIGLETLNIKGMVKNHCLARSISDMGFHEFRRQVTYKMERQGEKPVVAGPWFPSSKLCSIPGCGYIMKKLPLRIREWTCPACGARHRRDLNAAINLKNLAVSSTVTACGASSDGGTKRPKKPRRSTSHGASKQEFNTDSEHVPQ